MKVEPNYRAAWQSIKPTHPYKDRPALDAAIDAACTPLQHRIAELEQQVKDAHAAFHREWNSGRARIGQLLRDLSAIETWVVDNIHVHHKCALTVNEDRAMDWLLDLVRAAQRGDTP